MILLKLLLHHVLDFEIVLVFLLLQLLNRLILGSLFWFFYGLLIQIACRDLAQTMLVLLNLSIRHWWCHLHAVDACLSPLKTHFVFVGNIYLRFLAYFECKFRTLILIKFWWRFHVNIWFWFLLLTRFLWTHYQGNLRFSNILETDGYLSLDLWNLIFVLSVWVPNRQSH